MAETKKIFFEDYRVGDSKRSIPYRVSKEEIITFATKWDPQPFHVDEDEAQRSHFGGLTACSAHIFSIFCIISQQWEGEPQEQQAIASLGFDELRMHYPVYAGDTVTCVQTIETARPSNSKPDRGIVVARCELVNQEGKTVFSLKASFLMRKREV